MRNRIRHNYPSLIHCLRAFHILIFAYLFFCCYCYNLQNQYCYLCHRYRYYHITLLLNTLLQILSYPGAVELTTQLLILDNIPWLPLCRINKFGLNTLPSKTIAIPYTCGLSGFLFKHRSYSNQREHRCKYPLDRRNAKATGGYMIVFES